jgi:hypothetical protein
MRLDAPRDDELPEKHDTLPSGPPTELMELERLKELDELLKLLPASDLDDPWI